MHVKNVEKPLVSEQILLDIREFTVVKNPMNVVTVGKLSGAAQGSLGTGESILERNLTVVKSVGKPSARAPLLFSIRRFTVETKAMHVLNVVRLLGEVLFLGNTKESILVRNLMNVMNVKNPLIKAQPSPSTREPTLGKNLMNAMNVGKYLGIGQALCSIREHTPEFSSVGKS